MGKHNPVKPEVPVNKPVTPLAKGEVAMIIENISIFT
jgi:hypothetical protein